MHSRLIRIIPDRTLETQEKKKKKKGSLTFQGVRNKYTTTDRYTCLPGAIQKVCGRLLFLSFPRLMMEMMMQE